MSVRRLLESILRVQATHLVQERRLPRACATTFALGRWEHVDPMTIVLAPLLWTLHMIIHGVGAAVTRHAFLTQHTTGEP